MHANMNSNLAPFFVIMLVLVCISSASAAPTREPKSDWITLMQKNTESNGP